MIKRFVQNKNFSIIALIITPLAALIGLLLGLQEYFFMQKHFGAEELDTMRSYFFERPTNVLGDHQYAEVSETDKSKIFPRFISLRKAQIQEDIATLQKSGVLPVGRRLGINLSNGVFQNMSISQMDLTGVDFSGASFYHAEITANNFERAFFDFADFRQADLEGNNFSAASLLAVDLSYSDIDSIEWDELTIFYLANIHGVSNPPPGFIEFAKMGGALDLPRTEWLHRVQLYRDFISGMDNKGN